jgi:hypothetical protein
MATASTSFIESTLRRMAQSGDLDVVAKQVEDELLKKLATFPVANHEDMAAFAYRQGWLRGLHQVEAMLDPERVRRAMEVSTDDYQRSSFDDERF